MKKISHIIFRHICLLVVIILSLSSPLFAQQGNDKYVIRGFVEDSISHEKLSFTSVTLLRGGKPLKFTQSKSDGSFSIATDGIQKGDLLQATYLGYKKTTTPVTAGKEVVISMTEEDFALKEVVVQGARMVGNDTITVDLTRFTNERDNSLKDVLKKLPGVDVAKDGQISYNGKEINRFTVEGLDMTNGRYNMLTDNIKAKDVKSAEIIEHDQPIKALQKKTITDNVAMNIVLNDSVRNKYLFTLKPYLLVGNPTHVGGNANVMQIGRKRQVMYDATYNRSGEDVAANLKRFGGISNFRIDAATLPQWLSAPQLSAPIDEERLRFNTSQKYAVNLVTQSKSGNESHISASYLRSVIRQTTTNTSVYDLGGTAPVTTSEDKRTKMIDDAFNMEVEHKVNNSNSYGNEHFSINANKSDGLSNLGGDISQRIRIPQIDVEGSLYRIFVLSKSQLSWRSTADYHHSTSDLYVNEDYDRLITNLWHTAHSLDWMKSTYNFIQSYGASFDIENTNVREGNNTNINASLSPSWTYKTDAFRIQFSPQMKYERLCRQNSTYYTFAPQLYMSKKLGSRQEVTLLGGYNRATGGLALYALSEYRRSYRSWYANDGVVPEVKDAYANFSYQYRRPIVELFVRASATYSHLWNNYASDLRIEDGNYYTTFYRQDSESDNVSAQLFISKGFSSINLKTSLSGSYALSKGEQYSQGKAIDYRINRYAVTPYICYSPEWCQIAYEGVFSINKSEREATSTSLFNWKQSFSVTATIRQVDLSYSLVHYRNELQSGNTVNTLLSDAGVVWRLKKVRLSAELRNIFNKKSYAETTYSGVGTLTDSYILRPRELMLSAQYSF